MTKQELLEAYRSTLLELGEIKTQLSRCGTDGRPGGCRGLALDRNGSRTNDPAAAMFQLADGLEEMAVRKRHELDAMRERIAHLLDEIRDMRTYTVVQRYYLLGESDEQIGVSLMLSRQRICQIRRAYLSAA